MIKYQLYSEKEKRVVYETYNGLQAFFIDVAMSYGGHTLENAIELSFLGYEAYLKAEPPFDVGKFADYLAEKEDINKFKKMTRTQVLENFYKKKGY